MSLLVLPRSLIILIHLHLLKYPLQDTSRYDENIFNPNMRGIGERTRSMEDISYFLVGKLEGMGTPLKKILPTYPCLQPSDTIAFRTALTKYLEMLKSNVLRPPHTETNKSVKDHTSTETDTAWWWKEVIIRKSLLEECSGERFERLLLAFSTHALLHNTPSQKDSSTNMYTAFSVDGSSENAALAQAYAAALDAFQRSRNLWDRSAFKLYQRAEDVRNLRARLTDPNRKAHSKYDSLETAKLLALRQSRLQDILGAYWREEGQKSLLFLAQLSGLQTNDHLNDTTFVTMSDTGTGAARNNQTTDRQTASELLPPPSLPIAAAHHPTHMKTLCKPIFKKSLEQESISSDKSTSHENTASNLRPRKGEALVSPIIEDRLNAELRSEQSLQNALLQVNNIKGNLVSQLSALEATRDSATKKRSGSLLDLHLPESTIKSPGVNFKTSPSLIDFSSLETPLIPADRVSAIQERIAKIRDNLSPPWPTLHEPNLDPSPPPSPPTRLRQPSATFRTTDAGSKGQPNKTSNEGAKSRTAMSNSNVDMVERPTQKHRRTSRMVSPRKSNVLMKGRARRSSVFARRKTITVTFEDEIDRIASEVLDESTSSIELDLTTATPKPRITKGTPLTPFSTIKRSIPRPSFDIERHERAINVPLPRPSLGHDLVEEDEDEDEASNVVSEDEGEGHGETCEGNSMTLKDMLLNVDPTQFNLLGQEDIMDESLEWD